jgi:hypothetical protein
MRTDYRDNMPAIEVKDHALYWGTSDFGPYLTHMSEDTFGALYTVAQERFWADAQLLAEERFGPGHKVYNAGRSGGWLAVDVDLPIDHHAFWYFAHQVRQLMSDCRSYLRALVIEAATDESNITRSSN